MSEQKLYLTQLETKTYYVVAATSFVLCMETVKSVLTD